MKRLVRSEGELALDVRQRLQQKSRRWLKGKWELTTKLLRTNFTVSWWRRATPSPFVRYMYMYFIVGLLWEGFVVAHIASWFKKRTKPSELHQEHLDDSLRTSSGLMSAQSRWRVIEDLYAGSLVKLLILNQGTFYKNLMNKSVLATCTLYLCIGLSTWLRSTFGQGLVCKEEPECVFEGIMKKELFVNTLDGTLFSFIENVYPEGHKFMMDNDLKHTSGYAADWMRENGVNWCKIPAKSPDLRTCGASWRNT